MAHHWSRPRPVTSAPFGPAGHLPPAKSQQQYSKAETFAGLFRATALASTVFNVAAESALRGLSSQESSGAEGSATNVPMLAGCVLAMLLLGICGMWLCLEVGRRGRASEADRPRTAAAAPATPTAVCSEHEAPTEDPWATVCEPEEPRPVSAGSCASGRRRGRAWPQPDRRPSTTGSYSSSCRRGRAPPSRPSRGVAYLPDRGKLLHAVAAHSPVAKEEQKVGLAAPAAGGGGSEDPRPASANSNAGTFQREPGLRAAASGGAASRGSGRGEVSHSRPGTAESCATSKTWETNPRPGTAESWGTYKAWETNPRPGTAESWAATKTWETNPRSGPQAPRRHCSAPGHCQRRAASGEATAAAAPLASPAPKPAPPTTGRRLWTWPAWLRRCGRLRSATPADSAAALLAAMRETLEQTKEEPPEVRRQVFRNLQRKLHPDKNVECAEAAKLAFQELMEHRKAYLTGLPTSVPRQ